jgi:hypothetical protein
LYNVLRAYANYDPEIGYAQGMGIVISWLLRHTRNYKYGPDSEYP